MGFISFCDYTYQTMRDIPVLQMTRILFMFSCKLQNPHSGYTKYSPSPPINNNCHQRQPRTDWPPINTTTAAVRTRCTNIYISV